MGVVSVLDVAQYVLSKQSSPVTTMKLQKLCYYSQAWHLAWTGSPLFRERVLAWANGPVVRELFEQHRGKYAVTRGQLHGGDPLALSADQAETIDAVLDAYGSMSGARLSVLTHAETPWKAARGSIAEDARSGAVISHQAMRDYYTTVAASDDAVDPDDVDFPSWA